MAQGGPGPGFQDPIISIRVSTEHSLKLRVSVVAEAQSRRVKARDRAGGHPCDLCGQHGEHLLPLRSLFDIRVDPKACVVLEPSKTFKINSYGLEKLRLIPGPLAQPPRALPECPRAKGCAIPATSKPAAASWLHDGLLPSRAQAPGSGEGASSHTQGF